MKLVHKAKKSFRPTNQQKREDAVREKRKLIPNEYQKAVLIVYWSVSKQYRRHQWHFTVSKYNTVIPKEQNDSIKYYYTYIFTI